MKRVTAKLSRNFTCIKCETIDELAMAISFNLYGFVLRRDDGHVVRRALDFEVECQR